MLETATQIPGKALNRAHLCGTDLFNIANTLNTELTLEPPLEGGTELVVST